MRSVDFSENNIFPFTRGSMWKLVTFSLHCFSFFIPPSVFAEIIIKFLEGLSPVGDSRRQGYIQILRDSNKTRFHVSPAINPVSTAIFHQPRAQHHLSRIRPCPLQRLSITLV